MIIFPLSKFIPPSARPVTVSDPLSEFVVRMIAPSGIFAVGQEFDNMVVVPLSFARTLLDQPENVSSLEINYKKGTNLGNVQENIQNNIGKDFTVKNPARTKYRAL